MKRHLFLTALIILLPASVLPRAAAPQSRPYAKYGASGETIGLFNLMRSSADCGTWHVVTGTIAGVRSQKREKEIDYRLTLRTAGRLRTFAFTVGVDDIPKPDIVNLATANRSVKLRACESTKFLLAEEITRW
jgi:hypothetical protein